jgi:hypothetical protein
MTERPETTEAQPPAPPSASAHVALRLFMAAVALAAGIAAVVVAIQLVRTVI